MAVMIESSDLDRRLHGWISENLTVNFIEDYVIDQETYTELENDLKNQTTVTLKPKLMMDHNGEVSDNRAILYAHVL
jgi:hypothetical protein